MWTNTYPDNLAPRIESLTINKTRAVEHVHLLPGETNHAQLVANDPDGDELSLTWELLPEPAEFGAYAGQGETKPTPVEGFIVKKYDDAVDFRVPSDQPVNYRLFVYVRDGQGHIATANIPFYVSTD